MSLPRALEKLDDRVKQPLPPHKLTIGIFSKLWRSEKSASLIVEGLYPGVKKILRRRCRAANRRFPGFFRFRYVRLAKRPALKSRIIDAHAVLWAAHCQLASGEHSSQLQQVVRYSIRLRCSTAAMHHWIGAGSAIGSSI
jgi:hypothetical protein